MKFKIIRVNNRTQKVISENTHTLRTVARVVIRSI